MVALGVAMVLSWVSFVRAHYYLLYILLEDICHCAGGQRILRVLLNLRWTSDHFNKVRYCTI